MTRAHHVTAAVHLPVVNRWGIFADHPPTHCVPSVMPDAPASAKSASVRQRYLALRRRRGARGIAVPVM